MHLGWLGASTWLAWLTGTFVVGGVIGVGPDRQVVGLSHDYQRVKPPNGDGFVN